MVEASTGGPGQIVVAEMGNKRKNISDEDLAQCIKDIASWLQEKASAHYESRMAPTANGASAEKVNAVLATFSAQSCQHLALSLQKFNGGLQYQDNFIGLSVDEINAVGDGAGLKERKIVPFARDAVEESELLCVQIGDDGSETVVGFDCSDQSVGQNFGMAYGEFLENMQ